MKIPKIILQVTKDYQPLYVQEMILQQFDPSWKYFNFTDKECIEYFQKYPCPKFPNLISKFLSLSGPHRSDLFRYYFLYQHGGVYLDGDFMLYIHFSQIYHNQDFISIKTYHTDRNAIFNGFLIVTPQSKIIWDALQSLYYTPSEYLSMNYLSVCDTLYSIVMKYISLYDIFLYQEIIDVNDAYVLSHDKIISKHYWKYKYIPPL